MLAAHPRCDHAAHASGPQVLPAVLRRVLARARTGVRRSARPTSFRLRSRRCVVCAIPVHGKDVVCGRCLASPPHFVRATALADYAPPVDGMVTALKFGARLDLANLFGRLLARRTGVDAGRPRRPGPARVRAPVRTRLQPVAADRARVLRRHRRAPGIGRRAAHPAYAAAAGSRARGPAPQRPRRIRAAGDVAGRTVLVVDDVMTSGSTMDEIARVLVAAGAARVHALVVARTP